MVIFSQTIGLGSGIGANGYWAIGVGAIEPLASGGIGIGLLTSALGIAIAPLALGCCNSSSQ